jgi:hypothetical protein
LPEEAKWEVTLKDLESGKVLFLLVVNHHGLTFLGLRRKARRRDQCHRALQCMETARL